jgi:hypothetical protein
MSGTMRHETLKARDLRDRFLDLRNAKTTCIPRTRTCGVLTVQRHHGHAASACSGYTALRMTPQTLPSRPAFVS